MEEKLSALETLGVFTGLAPIKHWYAYSSSLHTKGCSTSIQIKPVLLIRKKNVIRSSKNNISLIISKNTGGGCNDSRYKTWKKKKETEQNISFESCTEIEMIKSETDIPGNNSTIMNAYCDKNIYDSKEKTEASNKTAGINPAKQVTFNEENSLEETHEEIESNENEEANHEILKKKIPSTVQEWVNHLPMKDTIASKGDDNYKEAKEDGQKAFLSDENPLIRAQLSREASLQSSSSLDSILDSRKPDPVEIFLNLGFGGLPGVDTENCRIPKRFLVPSKCKGGDWNEFLNRELIQAQNFECSTLGFRGLSGPSYRRPSAIVANIMEKLRECAVPQPHNRSRFSTVAKMVLNEKSVLNKLTPEFQSVLSPDNRKFLQNQGKKSPEVPRRRIIFGQKSFAFAHDGEFIEVESSKVEEKTTKDSSIALIPSDGEESTVYPKSDVLLKLRRSSLQKQKKVEEDTDVDDVFYIVGNKEHSSESPYNKSGSNKDNTTTTTNIASTTTTTTITTTTTTYNNNNNNNECSKKAGKIPRRFLSSTNLKALEENNMSEAMRLEVEKEIISLSQKIKTISNQDLPIVLQQVKELRSKIENSGQESNEI